MGINGNGEGGVSGYPRVLRGPIINAEAKILAVTDIVDAICRYRVYRPATGMEEVADELTVNRGSKYDRRACDAALTHLMEKRFWFE